MATAAEDAKLLLQFASSQGIAVPPQVITDIVAFDGPQISVSPQIEQSFWAAFGALAAMVKPASLGGIRAEAQRKTVWTWRGRDDESVPELGIRKYRSLAWFAFLLVVVVQAYTVFGRDVLATVEKSQGEVNETQTKIDELRTKLRSENKEESADATLQGLEAQQESANVTLTTYSDLLASWSQLSTQPAMGIARRIGLVGTASADETASSARNAVNQQLVRAQASFVLATSRDYVLPLLYGLLGSSIFILRSLASEIKSHSFVSDVGYRLRLPLGALAGSAMTWFNPSGSPEAVRALTPVALAFLAGYSVEVLFAAMDRFITAFSVDQTLLAQRERK